MIMKESTSKKKHITVIHIRIYKLYVNVDKRKIGINKSGGTM